ncbi:MAG: PEP-CTERM sorting domain-containing protein [Gemmatimonas sp.]
MIRRLTAAFALAFATSPLVADAQIFDNGAPNATDGWNLSGMTSAEDFTLAQDYTVTGIRFWAFSLFGPSQYSGSITWGIYSDNVGLPGSMLFSGTASPIGVNQGPLAFGGGFDQYQFDIATNFNLSAGSYWVSLYNGPFTGANYFYWQTTAPNASSNVRGDLDPSDGNWEYTAQNDYAFQLFGQATPTSVVPEPTTYVLLATGLVAIGLARRCRRV